MGDCGTFDTTGRLWFCGRKVERVETAEGTLFTEPCEQVFRVHPQARRCALIGIPSPEAPGSDRRIPALVVETRPGGTAGVRDLVRGLRILALQHPHTAGIKTFFFRRRFPLDTRHNAKIHRLTLAAWAASGRTQGYTVE
jgi:acyl-coenzyme A synthetase/AMP-(fatty) acid ligase